MPKFLDGGLSRREILAGGAAFLTMAGAGLKPSFAASGPITIGDMEVQTFSDGHLTLPMSFVLPEQTKEEVADLLTPHGMATDALTPDCNVTLLRTGDRLVLFDVGSGANFQPTAGELLSALEHAGIGPDDVTDVIFTHGHPDHLWGVLDDFDEPLFSEAQYWVPQTEWEYWRADDTLANTPEDRKTFVVGAQARFEAIEDQVAMITPGMEVLPGVEAIDTSGHTPGHTSYMLHGGGDSMLVVGDAISNAVISFEKPTWQSGTDQDPEMGVKTRSALLDRIATDKTKIIGYHLPHPGHGIAERKDTAYRFVATG
ncbi:MBL fold metallo-hydrolase [uncultured Roseibium sp.]|uniref:MBL fold metallo-hydrolase n=1 Tax=uncultured Roseibium sp. TaxID=1936171 RepID=UPI0032175978